VLPINLICEKKETELYEKHETSTAM